jgi:hypothetical protein
MAALSIFLTFLDFVLSIFLIFLTIVIFHPINKYKRFKVKEDQLFLQKILITTLFFCFFLLFNILSFFDEEIKKHVYLASNFFFNTFFVLILLYNLMMTIEIYRTYVNPVHYFNRLFRQKQYNYIPELIILIIAIISLSVDLGIAFNKLKEESEENNDDLTLSYLFLIAEWKPFVIIIISIICIIFYCKLKSLISNFYFNHQDKLLNVISKRSMNNYLYLVFGIFYLFPLIEKIIKNSSSNSEYVKLFGTLFFYIVIIDDYFIHLSEISTSKFCEYPLKRTLLGYFCSCFYKPKKAKTGAMAPLIGESSVYEKTELTGFQNDFSSSLDLVSNRVSDKELISVYKNGLFIEDYFLSYFDQILNIITSSLNQAYNSKYFSTQANEQTLTSKLKIEDISAIGGNMKDTSVSAIGTKTVVNTKSELGDDTVKFNITKNIETDDLKRFQNILENRLLVKNHNNFLNISLNSFFTPRCLESIYNQKIKGRHVSNSLLSHMIFSPYAKNKNPDNPNANYWSLFASNAKEQYFNKMKNTSIKTFDKQFTIDLFDTDNGELNFSEKGDNSVLAQLLDQYFTYIHGKGINGTFIPSLVGVFKIKINNFKTLLVFITKNSLVENAINNNYSHWQLLRIMKGKPQKVASSQVNSGSTLVKDDPIFERAFQIETIKDNPNYNKIAFKNYNDFQSIIQSDIEFMRQVGGKNFDLLLMYYEFENTQKHEKQGAIKIRQTNQGAEIVEESLPEDFLDDEMSGTTPISKPKKKSIDFLSMGNGGFLDEDNFGNDYNMKKVMNALDKDDNNYMNGFEGLFDNFNCICFFTFENVFDIRKREAINDSFYANFRENILSNFTEYKNK